MEWTDVKTVKKKRKEKNFDILHEFSLRHCTDRYHMFTIKQEQLRIWIDGKFSCEILHGWVEKMLSDDVQSFSVLQSLTLLHQSWPPVDKSRTHVSCSFSVKIKFRYIWLLTIIY